MTLMSFSRFLFALSPFWPLDSPKTGAGRNKAKRARISMYYHRMFASVPFFVLSISVSRVPFALSLFRSSSLFIKEIREGERRAKKAKAPSFTTGGDCGK